MKSVKALVLVILLLTLFSISNIQSVDAQDTEILAPNLEVSGTISSTHLSDYYRVEISQPGVYKIELNSTGSSLLEASFNRFSYGYPSTIRSCYSNTSSCFTIIPSSQYYGSFYQLDVSIEEGSIADLTDYTVSIERVEPIAIEEGQEYTLLQDAYTDSHYLLNVDESHSSYRFIASSEAYCYFTIYNSYGIRVYYRQCSPYYTTDEIVMFDPGIHHLFINLGYSVEREINFQITPVDIPILEPDSDIQVNFENFEDNPPSAYVQLPLTEGTQYSIELAPQSTLDVGFDIWFNPGYGITINEQDPGLVESVADFTYWDDNMAYTGWDTNPEMEFTQSDPYLYRAYSLPYRFENTALLLRAFSSSEGSATLSLRTVREVQTLSTDTPVTAQFDGIDGPFWKLFKMDNLVGGQLYNFNLTHTPTIDYTLNPSYVVYRPEITDQNYLSRTRPLLSEIEQSVWDDMPGTSTYLQHDSAILNPNAFFYQSILCESWLYVSIPDGYYNGHYSYDPIHSGDMELEVHCVAPIIPLVDSQITMDASLDTSLYSLQLEGDCIYQVAITGSNYQSYGQVTLWNETGHQIPYLYSTSAQTDRNTRYYLFNVDCGGEHLLLVKAFGDLPITITITNMKDPSDPNGVQYPFFIGGLAVAAIEGILIGIVIGKLKFGKEAPD